MCKYMCYYVYKILVNKIEQWIAYIIPPSNQLTDKNPTSQHAIYYNLVKYTQVV